MYPKVMWATGLAAAIISGGVSLMSAQTISVGEKVQADVEKYLKEAKVLAVEKEKDPGRTAIWRITLDDGQAQRQAVFKHANRTRPTLLPDSYKYELAAYELGKLLGINFIPPLVEREIEGIHGSLQLFLEDILKESNRRRKKIEPPDPQGFQDALDEIKVFENLVHDECQDAEDIFIHETDWKIWRIDFSEAFPPEPNLIPGCTISRCSKKLHQSLQNITDDQVIEKLGGYLNEEEIEALLQRKRLILKLLEDIS